MIFKIDYEIMELVIWCC